MINPTSARPLVTFALFAYNQEKFIGKAVEGALAQTYEPLEIILSDDCSTDSTFEIMKKMVAAYKGPHLVKVRQTAENLRPYSHVLDVARIASGQLLILSAGDDVSKAKRTARLVVAWKQSSAWALHSRYDLIDQDGVCIGTSQRREALFSPDCEFRRYFYAKDGPVDVIHGATSAYDIRLFEIAPSDSSGILSEDGALTILLNMAGKRGAFLDESLVFYRQHDSAISNSNSSCMDFGIESCKKALNKEKEYSRNIANRSILALRASNKIAFSNRRIQSKAFMDEIVLHCAKADWENLNRSGRLKALRIAITKRRIGYLIPSILGDKMGPFYLSTKRRICRFLAKE